MLRVETLFLGLVAFVFALSVAPVLVPWGAWLSISIAAFVIFETALIVWIGYEAGKPEVDGPGVAFAGLFFVLPGVIFGFTLLARLIGAAISQALTKGKPTAIDIPNKHSNDGHA